MKVFWFLSAFSAIFSVAYSEELVYPKRNDKPGYCWTDPTGPLEKGEQVDIEGACSKAECLADGRAQVVSCGLLDGPNGVTGIDYSKPYPECCPHAV